MATTKKTNVNKNTVTNKKSATTKRTIPVTDGNETKVMCPVCGTEFAIGEHEHTVKNATVIGADSGLGNVYLPVSKRGEALKAAGIDTSKYFSIQIPGGGEQWMQKADDSKTAVPVSDPNILGILNNIVGDPIAEQIIKGGTVPNRNLYRRWVMSQVFHGLMWESRYSGDGFTGWLKMHGYKYQWEMLVEELRVQARLYKNGDMENFNARNRWFDKILAIEMACDHIEQMRQDANDRPQHKCKGVPYVKYDGVNYFVSDIEKKLIVPMHSYVSEIQAAKNPQQLYEAVKRFCDHAHLNVAGGFKQNAGWKDAYKGMGAYATMQNLLRFHGCKFPNGNTFYHARKTDLQMLENAAKSYENGEGWRLFGLMKQMLEMNGIDIKTKMAQWAAEKSRR